MRRFNFLVITLLIVLFSCSSEENQISSDQIEMCSFNLIDKKNNSTTKPDAAIINWPRWETGQTIKIKFLDGDSIAQEKVKKYAAEWEIYANVNFEYVSQKEYADIRIGFQIGQPGAWSELGMKSFYGVPDHQSMRLGPLTANDESSVRRTILHEFGHALGLVHETTNPAATINWNLPKVYEYYGGLQGWSKEEIDEFVIKKSNSTNYSEYDPLSIMHYYIHPSLTTDGKGVYEMTVLSDIDKKSITEWYPFPVRSVIETGERIDIACYRKCIKSPNGRYSLEFDSGCLFILDNTNNQKTWSVGAPIYNDVMCFFQSSSGEIIIVGSRPNGTFLQEIIWRSRVSKIKDAQLHLQDNGDLELIQNAVVKWSSQAGKI